MLVRVDQQATRADGSLEAWRAPTHRGRARWSLRRRQSRAFAGIRSGLRGAFAGIRLHSRHSRTRCLREVVAEL